MSLELVRHRVGPRLGTRLWNAAVLRDAEDYHVGLLLEKRPGGFRSSKPGRAESEGCEWQPDAPSPAKP